MSNYQTIYSIRVRRGGSKPSHFIKMIDLLSQNVLLLKIKNKKLYYIFSLILKYLLFPSFYNLQYIFVIAKLSTHMENSDI